MGGADAGSEMEGGARKFKHSSCLLQHSRPANMSLMSACTLSRLSAAQYLGFHDGIPAVCSVDCVRGAGRLGHRYLHSHEGPPVQI